MGATSDELQRRLDQLEAQEAQLQDFLDVASKLERIQGGLESASLLSQPALNIPSRAALLLDNLGKQITQLSSPKLRAYLDKLESLVSQKVDSIIDLADVADNSEISSNAQKVFGLDSDSVGELAAEFQRLTQTAVSLRVLLIRRGAKVEVLVLPVPPDELKRHIDNLDSKSRGYAETITQEVRSTRQQVDEILALPELPEDLKTSLKARHLMLNETVRMLADGSSVEQLPIFPANAETAPAIPGADHTPDEPDPPESGEPAAGGTPDLRKKTPEPAMADPATRQPENAARTRGFFSTLWTYLTTPDDVTWEKARQLPPD